MMVEFLSMKLKTQGPLSLFSKLCCISKLPESKTLLSRNLIALTAYLPLGWRNNIFLQRLFQKIKSAFTTDDTAFLFLSHRLLRLQEFEITQAFQSSKKIVLIEFFRKFGKKYTTKMQLLAKLRSKKLFYRDDFFKFWK